MNLKPVFVFVLAWMVLISCAPGDRSPIQICVMVLSSLILIFVIYLIVGLRQLEDVSPYEISRELGNLGHSLTLAIGQEVFQFLLVE